MYPAPSLLHISEIRHEAFWSIMREREREFECPSCRDVTLNVSQAAEISYNVGIMPRNIGTLDGGEDIKKKGTGAKDRGRKGS